MLQEIYNRGFTSNPPNMVCVTAVRCKNLFTVYPCLYLFVAINTQQMHKTSPLDLICEITQITAHDCNIIHSNKGFIAQWLNWKCVAGASTGGGLGQVSSFPSDYGVWRESRAFYLSQSLSGGRKIQFVY